MCCLFAWHCATVTPVCVCYPDEALVVDVRGHEVLIRYIAWDPSFDEWMPRSSARLAERGTRLLAHMSAKDVLGTFAPGTHFAALLKLRKLRYLDNACPDSAGSRSILLTFASAPVGLSVWMFVLRVVVLSDSM